MSQHTQGLNTIEPLHQVAPLQPNNPPVNQACIDLAVSAHPATQFNQQQAETWLASRERLQLLVNYAPASLAMFDRNMRYLEVSQRWRDVYQLADREVIGHSHYEIFPDLPESWKLVHQRGLAGEVIGKEEDQLIQADGRVQWLRWQVRPWYTAQGTVGGIVIFTEDITERKQAKQALDESHALISYISYIIDIMPEAVLVVNENGIIQRANQRTATILGYEPHTLIGQSIDILVPSRFKPKHILSRQEFFRAPTTRQMDKAFELYALHREGYEKPVDISLAPLTDGDKQHVIVAIADISERKKHENELRLAASVFDNTLNGIVIMNINRCVQNVNRAFEKLLGIERPHINHKNIEELFSLRHNEAFSQQIWVTVEQTGSWQGELWFTHNDGSEIPLWLSISCQYSQDQKLERYIATMYDLAEQKLAQQRIHALAYYDALTGLANRTLFMDRLEHAMKQAKRLNKSLALLFIDLDKFKYINDTYGHSIGDAVLCQAATRLRKITRESDSAARLGGDEFTLLLEGIMSSSAIQTAADKILEVMSEPIQVGEKQFFISASIGISCFPEDGEDISSLLKHADLAMYRSKENGRNQAHFYRKEMSEVAQERITLQGELRTALNQQQLTLYFQPIIDLQTRCCIGAEVLARWPHPQRGMISPIKFISIAEENSLIHVLGTWILKQACLQMSHWLKAGLKLEFLSINVSGKQVLKGDFVDIARQILLDTNCPASHIMLELTESFIMNQSKSAIEQLQQLRDLGFGIAIDDFGTGYSSLAYLKQLPVTKIKLDQSFVHDIPHDHNDAAIARAIVRLGESVGLDVVSEGIETEAQHQFIEAEGCRYGQGYLYAKPMPADEFANYYLQQTNCRVE